MRKLPLEQLHQPAAALVAKWKKGVEAEKPGAAVSTADASAAEDSAKRSRSACGNCWHRSNMQSDRLM